MDYSTNFVCMIKEASLVTLLEVVAAVIAIWYVLNRPNRRKNLSDEERQFRLDNWKPKLICPEVDENDPRLQHRLVTGPAEFYISVNGKECLNLATPNYLSLNDNQSIRSIAADSIRTYGIGSAGPRGFYGTLDVHLELEDRLAKFMKTEAAVIYSYGFSTSASAIPAYCKRGDVIFADEMLHFAARQGLVASRSTIYYFKHNNMEHLESLLQQYQRESRKNLKKSKKTRLFLIVEGIYQNTGTLCPLPMIVELRNKYKLRLFLDESHTFGVLGATGRGISEYYNINREVEIDMIMSTLESSIQSTGGFCVGSHFIIEHQRLSGLGYCFSASCPPLLCKAAIQGLNYIEECPQALEILRANCTYLSNQLNNIPYLKCISHSVSPIKILKFRNFVEFDKADLAMTQIVQMCEDNGFAITKAEHIPNDESYSDGLLQPCLRLTVNIKLTKTDINNIVDCLIRINDHLLI